MPRAKKSTKTKPPTPAAISALAGDVMRLADMIDVVSVGEVEEWPLSVLRVHGKIQSAALKMQKAMVAKPPVKRSDDALRMGDCLLGMIEALQAMFDPLARPGEVARRLRGLATILAGAGSGPGIGAMNAGKGNGTGDDEWSRPLSKEKIADALDISKIVLESGISGGAYKLREAGNRQLWQINLAGLPKERRDKLA